MEPNEDSIKMLEMRIRQQMIHSSEKIVKTENIRYHLNSAKLQNEELWSGISGHGEKINAQIEEEKPQESGKLRDRGTGRGESGKLLVEDYIEREAKMSQMMEREAEMSKMMEYVERSGIKGTPHTKAKSGYGRVSQPYGTEMFFGEGSACLFDIKG